MVFLWNLTMNSLTGLKMKSVPPHIPDIVSWRMNVWFLLKRQFLNWIIQYQIVWDQKQNTLEEATVTQEYLNELEADVLAIDSLIAFAGSEKGEQVFGADQAKHIIINFILQYYIVNNNITDTLNEKHGLSYLFYFFIIVWFITLYMCVICIQRDFYIVW